MNGFKKYIVLSLFLGLSNFSWADLQVAPSCSSQKIDEILSEATADKKAVSINCSAQLPPNKTITKRLVFKGEKSSNIKFDCNNATLTGGNYNAGTLLIEVSSEKVIKDKVVSWRRPENIEIRNCIVHGAIRVFGMASNGEGADLRESSYFVDHTQRAQANAPKNIQFYRMKIYGTGQIPLYFSPGVTYSGLQNSEVGGHSRSVAIYFDAESANNILRNNYIYTKTLREKNEVLFYTVSVKTRELIAIDGSANNIITGNFFSSLNNGGIYLYRNCGEGGTVRHQAPINNQIIDNIFYYRKFNGEKPAVWIASRNGHKKYCNADNGYPFGSSINNNDLAKFNIVAKNQFYKFSESSIVRVSESDNMVFENETVQGSPEKRKSGCYLQAGYPSNLLKHGQSTQLFYLSDSVICKETLYSCNNGIIETKPQFCTQLPPVKTVNFSCQVNANNAGCREQVRCPEGTLIVGVRAACNLEYGSVSNQSLKNVSNNTLEVLRASDRQRDGLCQLDNIGIAAGKITLNKLLGNQYINYSCDEHDSNGGDCHIKGQLLCQ